MFENGTPLDIDKLLGLDGSTKKTRISVIYLNSLNSFREKDFFISELTKSLYHWMLTKSDKEDSNSLKCGFFIDEISPYIPPVKVTSSKIHLENIFRQGRKVRIPSKSETSRTLRGDAKLARTAKVFPPPQSITS